MLPRGAGSVKGCPMKFGSFYQESFLTMIKGLTIWIIRTSVSMRIQYIIYEN